MPDVLFETMIAAGLVLLLWPRPPGRGVRRAGQSAGQPEPGGAAGALVLGATTTVREIGGVLIVPAVVFAVATASGWRRRTGRAALAAACSRCPSSATWPRRTSSPGTSGWPATGRLRSTGGRRRPPTAPPRAPRRRARAVPVARPHARAGRHRRPAAQPAVARAHRAGAARHHPRATAGRLLAGRVPPAATAGGRVGRQGFIRLFALTRDGDPEVTSIARWQFQTFYPTYPHRYTMAVFTRLARQHGSGGDLVAVKPAATVLRDYQLGGGYTPGPLYAVGLVAGLLGSLGGLARRRMLGPSAEAHRRGPGTGRRLPAGDAVRHRAPAQLRRVRVLLALPAARRGHAARRGRARAHRPGRPDQAAPGPARQPSLLLGPPLAVQVDELVPHLRSQVLGRQPTGEADGLAHLRQVLGAVRAAGQVRLETAPGRPAERALPGSRSPARRPAGRRDHDEGRSLIAPPGTRPRTAA